MKYKINGSNLTHLHLLHEQLISNVLIKQIIFTSH